MIKGLTSSQQAVLGLLRKNLFGQEYDLPESTDIPALIRECRQQAVTAAALSRLKLHDDPQLAQAVYSAILNNNRVLNSHSELHKLLAENGIPYVILKGAASAQYYPDPLLRTMGDVDFLVKPEDMENVSALLLSKGYVLKGEQHRFHRTFVKDSVHLEAHFSFLEKINSEIDYYLDEYLSSIIADAHCISERYCTCMLPDKFHHGLILLLHMQRHMESEGLGLRHLCDWAVFVKSFNPNEFSNLFRERLERIGLWKYAQIISLSASIGLGLPYEEFMGENFSTAEDLLADIMASGNFGRRDHGRINERFFILQKAETGKERGRFSSFVYYVNRFVVTHWTRAEKSIFLLLIGWFYFGCTRLVLTLRGKRKPLALIESYKGSKERKDLYAKLHLFEPDQINRN